MDVETAFLYGDIDEEIFMKSPVGMEAMPPPKRKPNNSNHDSRHSHVPPPLIRNHHHQI